MPMKIILCLAILLGQCFSAFAQTAYNCAFTDRLNKSEKLTIAFVLDAETKRAYLMGSQGAANVSIVPNSNDAISFVEITQSGNVMTTTITNKGQAVHSRNSVLFGELIPSQYLGTCTRK